MLRTRDNVCVPFMSLVDITCASQIREQKLKKFKFLSFVMQNWIMELTYDSDVVNIEIFEL